MLGGISLVVAVAIAVVLPAFDPPSKGSPATESAVVISAQGPVEASPDTAAAAAPPSPAEAELELRSVSLVLEGGDTLMGVLAEAGLPSGEAYAASEGLKAMVDPRALRAGQALTLSLRTGGEEADALHLASLSLIPETDRMVVVEHQKDESFEAQAQPIEHTPRLVSAKGEIATSLYEAARDQGVPMAILLQAYQTLNHAVDFQREIRDGDTFALGYERFDDGENGGVHPGGLVYASLGLGGRTLSFYRYTTADGYTGFFDANGRSLETSLMKTPVDGGQLSSLFGNRDHPVLGYTRMHKGLDFAAPQGAPVLAAGDGVVERRSRYGSFGNYIRVRHDGTYSTAYAHLSRYAKGIEPGDRVRQGDVIGYVGATGLATGPNLHYEVLSGEDQLNPVTLDLPPRRVLAGDELARFRQAMARLLSAVVPTAAGSDARSAAESEGARTGDG